MEFIKIKGKHFLNTNFTIIEAGGLLFCELLTAHLERIPTDFELHKVCPEKLLKRVRDRLEEQSTTLGEVLEKVCEDVAEVVKQRSEASARMRNLRSKAKNTTPVHDTRSEQIREDKIRVYTSTTTPQAEIINSLASLYQKETGSLYQGSSKEFIIATNLAKKHTTKAVLDKIKIYFDMCKNKSIWFTKDGMADFNIGKLSSQWNAIIVPKITSTSPAVDPIVKAKLDAIAASRMPK